MAGNRPSLQGSNITGVSGAQHGAKQNAASMQRAGAAGAAGAAKYEFGKELSATGGAGTTGTTGTGGTNGTNTVGQSGSNITGVSGAQHGAKQNAASMQRAGQKAGK